MLNYLQKVLNRQDLTPTEMATVIEQITAQTAPVAQIGAFLAALRMKGEALSELLGAARVLRSHAVPIHCSHGNILDIVGTGGDGGISFNVSTTSAIVAAGAGATVAKHGNRAVSSKCGAADVLRELGFNLDTEPATMENSINCHGIGFLFAARLHPVLGSVAPIRRELKIRTIFNMLGPLCNPAGADLMLVGVYDAKLTELFARVLKELNVRRALVVHGRDGLDEISCADSTRVAELRDGIISNYEIFPEMLVGQRYARHDIAGGDATVNAAILRSVISGEDRGAARAIVKLNAGAAIYVAGLATTLAEGVELAGQAIDSGAAAHKLHLLLEASHA